MPALSNTNRREIRRFTAGIMTYGKQGQGHHRGDEQETWRRRLLFTTARRNPSAPTTTTTMPHLRRLLRRFDRLEQGRWRDRGGGDGGGLGDLSDNLGGGLQICHRVAPPRDTWRADWEPDGQQVVNRRRTLRLQHTETVFSLFAVHSDRIA